MEKLLEMARKAADEAEVYYLEEEIDSINFENGSLKDIESRSQCGLSLRVIKEGKLGFAYTKNLLDREELIRNGVESCRGGVEAIFHFPETREVISLDTYDPAIENLTAARIVEECQRVCEILREKARGQINVSAYRYAGKIRLINSSGTDLSRRASAYSLIAQLLYPGSYASIHRQLVGKGFEIFPDEIIEFMAMLYCQSESEAKPEGELSRVLFLPEAMYALMWRVQAATNGKNVWQKVSPILEKKGEQIFDQKLTIYDDPLNDRFPDARPFDDEGVACRPIHIVERGVLKSFYYDLHYAAKLREVPTGHGYKSFSWGGETVSSRPSPSLEHLFIKPGEKSFAELVSLLDRGLIVAGVMGAHSGNILNGDFSVGLSPGLYVEKGEIVGHIKDAMVAGNIYDVMKHIMGIENTLHPAPGGTFPAMLFENMKVAIKR